MPSSTGKHKRRIAVTLDGEEDGRLGNESRSIKVRSQLQYLQYLLQTRQLLQLAIPSRERFHGLA